MKCANCGKDMKLRKGSRGDFWGCSGYPNCKNIVNIDEPKEEVFQGTPQRTEQPIDIKEKMVLLSYAKDLAVALINKDMDFNAVDYIRDAYTKLKSI